MALRRTMQYTAHSYEVGTVAYGILVNLKHLKISILFFKLSSLDLTIYQTNDKMILEITYKFLF